MTRQIVSRLQDCATGDTDGNLGTICAKDYGVVVTCAQPPRTSIEMRAVDCWL